MKIKNNLIIDVGMHKAEDTLFFLNRGYNVVAIDADPALVQESTIRLENYIKAGKLKILNFAISDTDCKEVNFNISFNSMWNSLNSRISDRNNNIKEIIKVETRKLSTIINEYGIPYYCKIDVEGYDAICLETLFELQELPEYISVETECAEENEVIAIDKALLTLERLKELGYKRFKLVDQESLTVLEPDTPFFKKRTQNNYWLKLLQKILKHMGIKQATKKQHPILSREFNYDFPPGSSGPFGKDLSGIWLNFNTAKNTLIYHRSSFFKDSSKISFAFWCDWHATF